VKDKNLRNLLLHPDLVWSRDEILVRDCPVPREPGVYAWFFRQAPPNVPIGGCIQHQRLWLLYVGISPTAPPKNGRKPSKQTLRTRLRYHYRGNAEGSTLRLTLGCLLQDELRITLRRVGSGNRMTFTQMGEDALSDWMSKNAFVSWVTVKEPWILESELIGSLSLPLNLRENDDHPFHATLSGIRSRAKEKAREMAIA
jgi:hypothetical protein